MKICFRSDASVQIGTGHVMRCLTLANYLRACGHLCWFMFRSMPQSLQNLIALAGHDLIILETKSIYDTKSGEKLDHAYWLNVSQEEDAAEAVLCLQTIQFDCIIVDHYALDEEWESRVVKYCRRIMVIDDLADRRHLCNILVDQNVGRKASDYNTLLPIDATRLIGPHYAILRPEFAAYRSESLGRREIDITIKKILITMGGVDQNNYTGDILKVFKANDYSAELEIIVVMGSEAPWLNEVKKIGSQLNQSVKVLTGVDNMAKLMANCDLSIGAAGSTSWERCCLGLPSLVFILAENQISVANELAKSGACILIENMPHLKKTLDDILLNGDTSSCLPDLISSSSALVDGQGTSRVCDYLCR